MKKIRCPIWLKSGIMIVLAVSLLLAGTVQVFAASSEEKDVTVDSLSPIRAAVGTDAPLTVYDKVGQGTVNDGTAPPAAKDYADKFDVYTHVSVENGVSTVTVYSEEQLNTLNGNKWNVLTGDEMLYLMDDTLKLFTSYDVIRIRAKDGTLETYRGASYYSSEEYYNSFGLVTEGNENSYNLKQDVYNAIMTRLTVLCSASGDFSVSGQGREGYLYLGRGESDPMLMSYGMYAIEYYYSNPDGFLLPEDPDEEWCEDCDAEDIRCEWCTEDGPSNYCYHMVSNYESWLNCRKSQLKKNYGVVWFEQGKINYVADLSHADYRDLIQLYPDGLFDETVGNVKYDANAEKVAVIEVWETDAERVIARIRLDNEKNPDEIAQLEALWLAVDDKMQKAPLEDYFRVTDYRVAVYFNGFAGEYGDMAFRYAPDGDLDRWSFQHEGAILYPLFMLGTADIAAYVNSLLEATLSE